MKARAQVPMTAGWREAIHYIYEKAKALGYLDGRTAPLAEMPFRVSDCPEPTLLHVAAQELTAPVEEPKP